MPAAQDVVGQELSRLNKRTRYPLTKFQHRQIAQEPPIFIYNVSPIHEWPRYQGQLGTLTIRKRLDNQRVSDPLVIPGIVPRRYDKGLGHMEWFLDEGIAVAEDLVGCSKEYPVESGNNNLTNFGVFITRAPFQKLSKAQQDDILDRAEDHLKEFQPAERDQIMKALKEVVASALGKEEQAAFLEAANQKLSAKLSEMILQADQFASQGHGDWISQISREALRVWNQLNGTKETRPWAPINASTATLDCQFCGTANKPGVALCMNCKEVINQELYDSLKKKQANK